MTTIHVNASTSYDVCIGEGIFSQIGSMCAGITKAKKVAVISDSNVWPLYGSSAVSSLELAGMEVIHYIIAAGEASKNGQNYLEILNFLAQNRLTRSDCIIALGGGVVGDLTGFVAATYLRGIDYIQVPTTLLAAVDSSVGGKTAIDLPSGKNLAGAFYQPRLVLCDTALLRSLPKQVFLDGCAEVIKYAVLFDAKLYDHLLLQGEDFDLDSVIARCVELKKEVVLQDEFDNGQRMLLNLGHTVGHGIEAASDYTVSHGMAVAAGMAIISRCCAHLGICSKETAQKVIGLLDRFNLPTATGYSAQEIYLHALGDKKRSANTVKLIVIKDIASCAIHGVEAENLLSYIEAGL